MKKCVHKWEVDTKMRMFFGDIGGMKEEVRIICNKCGKINYISKENLEDLKKSKQDEKKIHRILLKLEKLWNQYPEQRLGQLLENYVFDEGNRGKETCFLFFQSDEDTEEKIDNVT